MLRECNKNYKHKTTVEKGVGTGECSRGFESPTLRQSLIIKA